MAAIKSYTDIEQSHKLAEFLPLKSADMCWFEGEPFVEAVTGYEEERAKSHRRVGMEMYPCWSLAALLGTLTESKICHYNDRYYCQYINESSEFPIYSTAEYDNPLDAAYELILKLHELNLL